MRPPAAVLAGSVLVLLAGFTVQPAEAQRARPSSSGAGAQAQPQAQQDTVRLVFEREVFSYPAFQRRNPFSPLTGRDDGPRFEDLQLLGVIETPDPGASVVLLGVRNGTGTFRVRLGETVGNSRVIEIRRQQVVMEVEEFGIRENRTLELRRTEPRPGPSAADSNMIGMLQDPPQSGDADARNGVGDHANGGSS